MPLSPLQLFRKWRAWNQAALLADFVQHCVDIGLITYVEPEEVPHDLLVALGERDPQVA